MAFPSRIRLGLLNGLLAGLWSYAIYTDHPAPAWGMSRLPDLLFSTIVLAVTGFAVTQFVSNYAESRAANPKSLVLGNGPTPHNPLQAIEEFRLSAIPVEDCVQ